MKQMVSSVELIIECRDYRVPLSSRNPLFEETLQGRERIIVYTKRDLAAEVLDLTVGWLYFLPDQMIPGGKCYARAAYRSQQLSLRIIVQ